MRPLWLALCSLTVSACAGSSSGAFGDGSPNGTGGVDLATPTVIFNPCSKTPIAGFDPDTRGLAKCCTVGAAHCVPTSQVLPRLADTLDTCGGDSGTSVCMPDQFTRAGSSYTPAPCSSLN